MKFREQNKIASLQVEADFRAGIKTEAENECESPKRRFAGSWHLGFVRASHATCDALKEGTPLDKGAGQICQEFLG